MEDISATLVTQLLNKALENTKPEDRLAFVEKLFAELPPAAQQEFLLKLTRMLIEAGTQPSELQKVLDPEPCSPVVVKFIQADLEDFTPGQMCCQALSGFASSEQADENQIMGIAQSTTSHHLRVLKEANMIQGEKRGRNIFYSLVPRKPTC
jgi:hypothetical protein